MKRQILFILALFCFSIVKAQDFGEYLKKQFTAEGDTLPYRILLPRNYNPGQQYPLILFLHGSGEKGRNNESQLVHGAKFFLTEKAREQYPAIVVFPQCPANSNWTNMYFSKDSSGKSIRLFPMDKAPTKAMNLLLGLVDELFALYKINKGQVFVGGLSMGGMGTFEIAWRKPGLFAAAFPICGGGNPNMADQLTATKWWVFHGAKDDAVLPVYSEIMVNALHEAGAAVKFTLFPEANHNSWDPAFAEPGLLEWMFMSRQ